MKSCVQAVDRPAGAAGPPYSSADCDFTCCNAEQCNDMQIEYTFASGSASNNVPDCTVGPPSPPDITSYFYGTIADFVANVVNVLAPVVVCPDLPYPPGMTCCIAVNAGAGSMGRQTTLTTGGPGTNPPATTGSSVTLKRVADVNIWPMGPM